MKRQITLLMGASMLIVAFTVSCGQGDLWMPEGAEMDENKLTSLSDEECIKYGKPLGCLLLDLDEVVSGDYISEAGSGASSGYLPSSSEETSSSSDEEQSSGEESSETESSSSQEPFSDPASSSSLIISSSSLQMSSSAPVSSSTWTPSSSSIAQSSSKPSSSSSMPVSSSVPVSSSSISSSSVAPSSSSSAPLSSVEPGSCVPLTEVEVIITDGSCLLANGMKSLIYAGDGVSCSATYTLDGGAPASVSGWWGKVSLTGVTEIVFTSASGCKVNGANY